MSPILNLHRRLPFLCSVECDTLEQGTCRTEVTIEQLRTPEVLHKALGNEALGGCWLLGTTYRHT